MSRRKRPPPAPAAPGGGARAVHYKVVELSQVDEAALERTLNEWAGRGWRFDGVQFAMRESSRRPAMGFVFFTREGAPLVEAEAEQEADQPREEALAREHLERLAREPTLNPVTTTVHDAWERLKAFARDDGEAQ